MDKLKQLLNIILAYAKSERFRVSAAALRALGYFLSQIDIPTVLSEATLPGQVRQVVHKSMHHKNPKVSWNACVVIGKTIKNESLARSSVASNIFFDERTVRTLFELVSDKPNIKARIQAIHALLCYKKVE